MAIEGNTIVIGSYYDDKKGSAYVFARSGAVWTQRQKLVASDAALNDRFGCAVAIDNNTIAIGAYRGNSYTGAVYVFVYTGSTWSFQQKLIASDAQSVDYFGYSVAIDNNTIIVGAPNNDYSSYVDAGSAYQYERQGATWLEQNILRASDSSSSHHLGYSVAIDGNRAVIGAYESDTAVASGAGAAYIFAKTGTGWVEQQKLFEVNDPCLGDDFGWSVALKGDTVLVGCPYDFVEGSETGSVFEFVRAGTSWIQNSRFTAGDANTGDKFGSSLALWGRNIIIGSPYNINSSKQTGSAYIFSENNSVAGDFDGDSDVDFGDFAILASAWRQNNSLVDIAPAPAGDGIIDIQDFDAMCDNWLAGK